MQFKNYTGSCGDDGIDGPAGIDGVREEQHGARNFFPNRKQRRADKARARKLAGEIARQERRLEIYAARKDAHVQ